MQYSLLSAVKHRISVGTSLPFNVYLLDASLLLARGQVLRSQAELDALLQRGALVDLADLQSPCDLIRLASPEQLPAIWRDSLQQMGAALRASDQPGFSAALDEVTPVVLGLIERDKDLAIFQIIKRQDNEPLQYGVKHALHNAITSFLVAQRLGWQDTEAQKVFKVALTMDISILDLQGRMAEQKTPITAEQRAAIHAHPERSEQILALAGINDSEWLLAVARHHETPDGKGYPHGCREPGDLATLAQRADSYTAMLNTRQGRDAMAADRAGRMMFMQDGNHPMTAALVKEFGLYPPGCFVRLASGETGVVVKRGSSVMSPIVAALTSPFGRTLGQPIRRDTAQQGYCIHAVLGDRGQLERLPPEALMSLA
jgi:HD-GYP domain-containing protein (c-di-GMP phosphodiesterase class II)